MRRFLRAALGAALLSLMLPAAAQAARGDVVGVWTYDDAATGTKAELVFNPDGTGSFNGVGLTYDASDSQIAVPAFAEGLGDNTPLRYSVQGNVLSLIGGPLDLDIRFARSGESPVIEPRPATPAIPQPASPARPAASITPTPQPQAPLPQRPGAGVYVSHESSSGGSQSAFALAYAHYLTLLPDGKVLLDKAEGSISKAKVADAMKRFEAVAAGEKISTRSAGTWKRNGETVRIRWTDGRTTTAKLDASGAALHVAGISIVGDQPLRFKRR